MSRSTGAADAKIRAAVLDILRSKGPRAVTVEGVSLASGVAKTTIYRRFTDRADMLAAVLAPGVEPDSPPSHVDGPGLIGWVIRRSMSTLDEFLGFGGFAALITDDDPEFTTIIRELLAAYRSILTEALERGVTEGLLRPGLDAETLVDTIVGAYVAERARTGTVADDWPQRLYGLLAPLVLD